MAVKKKKQASTKKRYSILIPGDDYEALKRRAHAQKSTVSAVVSGMLEARFSRPSRHALPLGDPGAGADCVRASVFLSSGLYKAAVHESERQHGRKVEDEPAARGRRASVFARVVVGMIAEMLGSGE